MWTCRIPTVNLLKIIILVDFNGFKNVFHNGPSNINSFSVPRFFTLILIHEINCLELIYTSIYWPEFRRIRYRIADQKEFYLMIPRYVENKVIYGLFLKLNRSWFLKNIRMKNLWQVPSLKIKITATHITFTYTTIVFMEPSSAKKLIKYHVMITSPWKKCKLLILDIVLLWIFTS